MRTVKELQEFLGVASDGLWGPKSQAALDAVLHATPQAPTFAGDKVDPRSESNIATLHPKLQPIAREFIRQCLKDGMIFKITSGTRTYEEQAILRAKYEAGGPKAARAGYSNHNFRLAFDVTEFDHEGKPRWESANYSKAGLIGKELGLYWGGSWAGRDQDEPHYELRPPWAANMNEATMIAELRRRHDNNIDPFV